MSLSDRRQRHDKFFRQAREEGFVARSVYKLEQIDEKLRLLRSGDRVLDLGCRPGSWLQYARQKVGAHGTVVGIDRLPLPTPIAGVRVIVSDLFVTTDRDLLGDLAAFDLVMSDMAPDTTGVRSADQVRSAGLFEEALLRAERLLAPGGAFVGKIFEGPDVADLRRRMRTRFGEVRSIKPESSRTLSIELYICGKGFVPA